MTTVPLPKEAKAWLDGIDHQADTEGVLVDICTDPDPGDTLRLPIGNYED